MIFLVVLGVDIVYHLAPNRRGRWVCITPGSLLARNLWMASSFAFLIKHEFIKRLRARFDQEGIVIPFPIRTIAQRDGAPGSDAPAPAAGGTQHSRRLEQRSADAADAVGLPVPLIFT